MAGMGRLCCSLMNQAPMSVFVQFVLRIQPTKTVGMSHSARVQEGRPKRAVHSFAARKLRLLEPQHHEALRLSGRSPSGTT